MFSIAFHFLNFLILVSLFLFICQIAGITCASLGTSDLRIAKKFLLSFWSVTSVCMAEMNSFWSGAFIASCIYRVSRSADALYASSGSSWPMDSSFGNIALRKNILPPTSWLVLDLISMVIASISRSTGWRTRFELLLVLIASWVANILSSGRDFGPVLGRESSPGSVGGKFGEAGEINYYGGALFLLLSLVVSVFWSTFGSLCVNNTALSCHLESSFSCLTMWKLGSKLKWNWGLTSSVYRLSTRATLCEWYVDLSR